MKFKYTILYVPDVTATVAFYESAFGATRRFVDESGAYAELETGETALAFAREDMIGTTVSFAKNRPNGAPAGAEVGFVSDNVDEAFAHALGAGAVAVVAPMIKPWGQTVSYVRDNNGFLVEICSAIS